MNNLNLKAVVDNVHYQPDQLYNIELVYDRCRGWSLWDTSVKPIQILGEFPELQVLIDTTLVDVEGSTIWEGDILRSKRYRSFAQVEYGFGHHAGFWATTIPDSQGVAVLNKQWIKDWQAEVIGSVHSDKWQYLLKRAFHPKQKIFDRLYDNLRLLGDIEELITNRGDLIEPSTRNNRGD